jgi:hypothetical protein
MDVICNGSAKCISGKVKYQRRRTSLEVLKSEKENQL